MRATGPAAPTALRTALVLTLPGTEQPETKRSPAGAWWAGGRSQAATEADVAARTLGGRGKRMVGVGARHTNMASSADGEKGATYHKKKNGNPTPNQCEPGLTGQEVGCTIHGPLDSTLPERDKQRPSPLIQTPQSGPGMVKYWGSHLKSLGAWAHVESKG